MKIQDLRAREIIDCKGKPLLEVDTVSYTHLTLPTN